MAGLTHSGTPTPCPMTLPLLSCHLPSPSMTTSSPAVCHLVETPLMSVNWSHALAGASLPTMPEVSHQSSEWLRTDPSSPTLNVTPSTELSAPELCALTPPEEREPATETPVAHST